MAGPERPRCVNRMFSRKLCPAQDAIASRETPARSWSNPSASGVAFSGTSPGSGSMMLKPKRRATS